jgi:hypothetical protein
MVCDGFIYRTPAAPSAAKMVEAWTSPIAAAKR